MPQGICRCGLVTAFFWETPSGEVHAACGALHARPNSRLIDYNKFEGQEYKHGTMRVVLEAEGAEQEESK